MDEYKVKTTFLYFIFNSNMMQGSKFIEKVPNSKTLFQPPDGAW